MEEKQLKRELFWINVIVWIAFAMMVGTRMCTLFVMTYTAEVTQADIEQVYQAYEANPIFKMQTTLTNVKGMLMSLILPAMLMTLYYYFRRKVKAGKMELDQLALFVTFLFFSTFLNLINDAAILVGMIM